ncbi:uncharacterized protein HMPREF1541_08621 [Cyphellophora europaea CBS 101466]|uniref:Zn(2)-C6 fungal-type domain-containing protein n=1 Tax=Cyphellophora europaea (strain CBS 101466) TaxID=1220924 RepID=W2RKT6_CYPE1|nr:uncharacterized protein HMPREF1541_08621 [Cyphellophora europaea CBS 101466]ETN36344.1 hypothetical protein HMPREF1541_08621 [Cyphellophora europaea CBS 101466]
MPSTPATGPSSGHPDYPEDASFEPNGDGRVEMAQDDVDAIIRNKRKVRDPKACYACHRRKVKCNRELPCDSCVKRDHPELCSYERPTKKRRIAMTTQFPRDGSEGTDVKDLGLQSGPNVTVPKEQWERVNRELQRLREQLSTGATQADADAEAGAKDGTIEDGPAAADEGEGIHAPSNQMGTMHLGSRSVLAYMMGLGRDQSTQDSAVSLLNDNILPKLGLDNDSVTYPFVDLWSTDNSIKDIDGLCSAIPSDELCKQFFATYRDVACTMYPVVPECDTFEATLNYMLANRAKAAREATPLDPNSPMGISLGYLALVFAVLVSGAQCSSISSKERELTSQVYICCSYQALRMGNFLTHPSLETIQALLVITNVLSYNMNPGVAYIFLGLVVRMAFSMGLQINQSGFSDHENWLRRRTWWAIAWQDSHFCVSYDRPSASCLCSPDIPYSPGSAPDDRNYAETMYNVIRLTQELVRERTLKPNKRTSWVQIQRYRDEVIEIISDATPHLRERTACGNDTCKHIERLALKLHTSYMIGELCRPALKEGGDETTPTTTPAGSPGSQGQRRKGSRPASRSPPVDPDLPQRLRQDCLRGLEGTITAYVELSELSQFAARSWIAVQRVISAAFLLGTLPEANQEPRIINVLRELEKSIAARISEDPGFDGLRAANSSSAEPAPELESIWARSVTKSLHALQNLNAALASHKAQSAKVGQAAMGVRGMYMDGESMRMATDAGATMPRSRPHMQPSFTPSRSGIATQGIKQEAYSPTVGAAIMMPHTIGSTSVGNNTNGAWDYGRLGERAQGYIQRPVWQ